MASVYRGRIAPTPTGLLHLGHAKTFATAVQRAQEKGGTIIFRNEDLDPQRCKPEFIQASMDDLSACGLNWHEGPDIGGPYSPYNQSERLSYFLEVWRHLKESKAIYPCDKSRKDVQGALVAPHEGEEVLFPIHLRPALNAGQNINSPDHSNWRFRVPDGKVISFHDNHYGPQSFTAGVDFGDFLVWRKDGFPAYELAVVADDYAMKITEVVRGKDLLLSTARQLLLYESLGWQAPEFYHCNLVTDDQGKRLAKRQKSLSLQELHKSGKWDNYKQFSF
jgi:glutamyl-tRNA synthetase